MASFLSFHTISLLESYHNSMQPNFSGYKSFSKLKRKHHILYKCGKGCLQNHFSTENNGVTCVSESVIEINMSVQS
jgi:hypothetical protein